LRFSDAIDAATVTADAVHATFQGSIIDALLHRAADGRTITLFFAAPLPASARIRVSVDGDLLRSEAGAFRIDTDGDGVPGGVATIDFDTLSLTVVPGTIACGRVFASELSAVSSGGWVNVPLQGVRITVDGKENTMFAVTDANGSFRLDPSPAGPFFVPVDGHQ